MKPGTSEIMKIKEEPLDHENPLEQSSSFQETVDLPECEHIKVEQYYPKPCFLPLQTIIKEELPEHPRQADDPLTVPSSSDQQTQPVKLEIKSESDDLGMWKNEPAAFNSSNKVKVQETQNATGKICNINKDPPNHSLIDTLNQLLVCTLCMKTFSRESHLKKHMSIHNRENDHKCSVCEQVFTQKSLLKQYTFFHTKENANVCSYCGKAFAHITKIRKHIVTQTREKPHKCVVCTVAFGKRQTMEKYLLIHTREKPHKCSVCGKKFAEKSSMAKHSFIHTSEKSHVCGICGKVFSRMCDLKQHKLSHTGEKPHECNVCGKGFAHASVMNRDGHLSIL